MEENNQIDSDYLKGFNDGYLIAQYEPELSEKLSKVEAVSQRIIGMQQGREQYLNEQTKDKRPLFLKDNQKAIEKDNLSKEKGKDKGLEPER